MTQLRVHFGPEHSAATLESSGWSIDVRKVKSLSGRFFRRARGHEIKFQFVCYPTLDSEVRAAWEARAERYRHVPEQQTR